jgi:hypothetical protein
MKTTFRAKGYTEEILDVEKAYAEEQNFPTMLQE